LRSASPHCSRLTCMEAVGPCQAAALPFSWQDCWKMARRQISGTGLSAATLCSLCAYLDEIRSYHQHAYLSSWFLYAGPLDQLGGYRAEEAEASTIVANTLLSYPRSSFRAAIGNAFRQLVSFRTILDTYPESMGVSTTIQSVFGPVVYEHYRDSRQTRGDFGWHFEFGWFEALNYFSLRDSRRVRNGAYCIPRPAI
jgi:hypothetical protein